MQQNDRDTVPAVARTSTQRPIRERVGMVVYGRDAAAHAADWAALVVLLVLQH